MPGCAAVGCNNRSEKGYIMKCFPRDPKLRKIWQDRVARADWIPSNNSFLCHVHFEADEWCIADNGRVRLKRDAIPSIFNVTSTRKSPKKRIKLKNFMNKSECENDYATVYLENDTEHSSTGHLEKDSDSQDADDSSVQSILYQGMNNSLKNMENKEVFQKQYRECTNNLQEENIIIISDDNMSTQDIIMEYDSGKQIDMENKISTNIFKENSTENPNENIIKTEIKRENDRTSLDDSFDEIEEKLKRICDGYREEYNSNNVEKLNSISRNQREVKPLHKSINYKYSSRNEIGGMLTNDTDNIEIIFGTESGEECTRVPKHTSYNNNMANEIDKLDQHNTNIISNNINDTNEIDKTLSRSIEEVFNNENMHVIPSMKAAIKRKRKIREEIKKSIEKSIYNASSHDTYSISNSDISDIAEVENLLEKKLNTSGNIQFNNCINTINTSPALTKFTVKVTGDPDDVFHIIQDLIKNEKGINIQEYKSAYANEENNTFVTSVITIDDCPIETNDESECNGNIFSTNIKSIASNSNDQILPYLSPSNNDESLNIKLMSHSDEELNDLNMNSSCLTSTNNVTKLSTSNYTNKYEYERLQRKLKMQEHVINKLINQLTSCKDIEKNLRNKYATLEKRIENLMSELNTKTDGPLPIRKKENVDLKQKLIDDLSNRLSHFEEANKKLVKALSAESQQRKKFEGQIKQRDNRIKELNWKLEKASKYFERAEKNTITYRRKMLNMQTFIRRKKLLDEKMSKCNEMLIGNVKRNYSKKSLSMEMAMEIKKTCGTNGYEKLLSFGFPLPELRTLLSDDVLDSNENTNEILEAIPVKCDERNEQHNIQCTKNGVEVESELVSKEIALDDTETITGTVQDIFDENNDADDFSTSELTEEHFISQLQASM